MKPYVFFYDRDSEKVTNMAFDNVTDTGYNTYTAIFNVPTKSVKNAAIGIGILSGKGGILIEEVLKRPYKPRNLRHYTGTLIDIRPKDDTIYYFKGLKVPKEN